MAAAEEFSGAVDKETFHQIYESAVGEEFSFPFLKPTARSVKDMFWLRFERRFVIQEDSDKE